MTFWNVFLGVFTGIFVGVQTNVIIEAIKKRMIQKEQKKHLKDEFNYNIKQINKVFLKDINDYLRHINGDSPESYFGQIHLTGLLKTTLNQMFADGSIYKHFDHENINKLQRFVTDFTPQDEERINAFLKHNRKIENKEKMREDANTLMNQYLKVAIEEGRENLLSIEFKNKKKVYE